MEILANASQSFDEQVFGNSLYDKELRLAKPENSGKN